MKNNLIVFLADLFNVLEINPIKCVRYPESDKNFGGKFLKKKKYEKNKSKKQKNLKNSTYIYLIIYLCFFIVVVVQCLL